MKIFLTAGTEFIEKAFLKVAVKHRHIIYYVISRKKNIIWLKDIIDKV